MNKKIIIYASLIFLAIIFLGIYLMSFSSSYKFKGEGPIKIFYLNSFHSKDFPLTQNNILAFKKVFEEKGIEIEVKQFDMNTIIEPSEESKLAKAKEAMELIKEYGPDLIYATDDSAQKYVVVNYINKNVPVVFSGVNQEVEVYEYGKAKNIAGVLERAHFVEVVSFLNNLYPGIKKIGVLGNDYFLWDLFMSQMKEDLNQFPEIEFVGWDQFHYYEDFQNKVLDYQNTADAIIFLGVDTIVNKNEEEVPRLDFVKWMVENNNLPEATFWNFYPLEGILLSVDVSAKEQGKSAGIMAYKILIEGENPAEFEFKPTAIGEQYINFARAKQLNLDIPSMILVNSKVYEKFPWEAEDEN